MGLQLLCRTVITMFPEMLNREKFHWKQQDKLDSGYRVSKRCGCKIKLRLKIWRCVLSGTLWGRRFTEFTEYRGKTTARVGNGSPQYKWWRFLSSEGSAMPACDWIVEQWWVKLISNSAMRARWAAALPVAFVAHTFIRDQFHHYILYRNVQLYAEGIRISPKVVIVIKNKWVSVQMHPWETIGGRRVAKNIKRDDFKGYWDVPGARLEWISPTLQGKPLPSRLAN